MSISQSDSEAVLEIRDERCPECGALVEGGRIGCQALFDDVTVKAFHDLHYAAVRDLAFDTYCMQHIEPYCHSAKSYAAHLTRLCCGIEYGGDGQVYAAIQKWLNGARSIEKPNVLKERGEITVATIQAAQAGDEQIQLIHRWVQTVWAAYAEQHELARTWIKEALGTQATSAR